MVVISYPWRLFPAPDVFRMHHHADRSPVAFAWQSLLAMNLAVFPGSFALIPALDPPHFAVGGRFLKIR